MRGRTRNAKAPQVIADASPLIGLARIGGLAWLPKLFGSVIVTPIVLQEILPARKIPDEGTIQAAVESGWLIPWTSKIKPLSDTPEDLDEGEFECISLAMEFNSIDTLLLIDERVGRAIASELGIPIAGTAAVIGLAKKRRLIRAAKPYFSKLHQSDFRLSAAVIQTVLKQLGEA